MFFYFLSITIPIILFFQIRPVMVEGHGISHWTLFAQDCACQTVRWPLLSLTGYCYWWVRCKWDCGCGCYCDCSCGCGWLHESECLLHLHWGSLRLNFYCLGLSWESLSNPITLESWGIISHINLSWLGNHGPFFAGVALGHFTNGEGFGLEG